MRHRLFALIVLAAASANAQWSQFAGNQKHTGNANVIAQPLRYVLADLIHDPFAQSQIESNSGELFIHYAVPLLDGDDVFMAVKDEVFIGPLFPVPGWGVKRLHWENGQLIQKWFAGSDWRPVVDALWEPPMQPVLANGFVYLPASGATLLKIDRNTGARIARINPFAAVDPATFMSGPPGSSQPAVEQDGKGHGRTDRQGRPEQADDELPLLARGDGRRGAERNKHGHLRRSRHDERVGCDLERVGEVCSRCIASFRSRRSRRQRYRTVLASARSVARIAADRRGSPFRRWYATQ